jgi:Zn-dependent protease/predicted transcriptional regulator
LRGTLPVGRVLGIPILINLSWFASLFLIVSLLSLRVFPEVFPSREMTLYWSLGLAGGLIFFLSVIAHELGHCVVARHYSIPVRSITLFIFGGVSQISHEAPRAGAEFLMAIAGPAVSFFIGVILLVLRQFVLTADTPVALLVEWLGWTNIVLAAFNMLPGFPMDGGRLLRSTIWGISGNLRLATRLAAMLGRGMAFALMGAGLLSLLQVTGWPLRQDPTGGLWLILVGLFLNRAAGQTQRQSRLMNYLRGYRADQIMDAEMPAVAAEAPLSSFIYNLSPGRDEVAFFVVRDGRIVGLLPRGRLDSAVATGALDMTAASLMIPAEGIAPARPEDDGAVLLERMEVEGLPGLPVVSAGSVTGLVTRGALFRLLRGGQGLRPLRL